MATSITITEDWIRERVKLTSDNLDDVRSLVLPGTYQEKISSVGDSLRHFTRLVSLDLSRNAIESLAGLENLRLLEKLNLYYNSVSSLDELSHLRFNGRLQEIDLRLNPVARNESDYRLFLVHMLPNLRRLDDRAVRDLERKAALMHYGVDQTNQFNTPSQLVSAEPAPVLNTEARGGKPNPRVAHVASLARSPFSVHDDDEALLSLVLRSQGTMSDKVVTGSTTKTPQVDVYPAEVIRRMNKTLATREPILPSGVNLAPLLKTSSSTNHTTSSDPLSPNNSPQSTVLHGELADFQEKYPNLYPLLLLAATGSASSLSVSERCAAAETIDPSSRKSSSDGPVKFADEISAYTSYMGVGNFTPAPDWQNVDEKRTVDCGPQRLSAHMGTAGSSPGKPEDCSGDRQGGIGESMTGGGIVGMGEGGGDAREGERGEYTEFMKGISELADKYWNGSKSLLNNERFKSNITKLVGGIVQRIEEEGAKKRKEEEEKRSNPPVWEQQQRKELGLQREVDRLKAELSRMSSDNQRLREKLVLSLDPGLSVNDEREEGREDGHRDEERETKLKTSLIRSQRDLAIAKGRLRELTEENQRLTELISSRQSDSRARESSDSSAAVQSSTANAVTVAAPGAVRSADRQQLDSMEAENENLRHEIKMASIKLKDAAQMKELASMLQESHRSLVETNDHLLQDLNDMRARYEREVSQLRAALQNQQYC